MSPEGRGEPWTDDAALGGRLRFRQPRGGHRFGHDAILLAAATGGRAGEHAVELGAGVGAAGLALAWRVPGLAVTLVEIDPALAAAAQGNAERNGLGDRVRAVVLDVGATAADFAARGLGAGSADRVLMNPPFHDAATRQGSPDPDRRRAYMAMRGTPALWVRTASRLLRPDGVVTLIYPADRLAEVLAALGDDFGAIAVLPVHPKPDAPAIRILVRAIKASRSPLALLPALLLNGADSRPTAAAEAILRGGVPLSLAED
jgi:tRNA1(Val) A37 N6-methylase TrmN6